MIASPSAVTSSLPTIPLTGPSSPSGSVGAAPSFEQFLLQAMGDVGQLSGAAQSQIQSGLVGDDLSMVETFTAMRESDLALRLMMQVRNKLLDAYQELQNMRF